MTIPRTARPGEHVIIEEIPLRPSDVAYDLQLDQFFSYRLMTHIRRVPTAIFGFAIDAATGYVHGFTLGKRGNPANVAALIKMTMRDKTAMSPDANHPWSISCKPLAFEIPASVRGFGEVREVLERAGCALVQVPESAEARSPAKELLARLRSVAITTGLSVVDGSVLDGAISDGAIGKLEELMVRMLCTYNHLPTDGGASIHQIMIGAATDNSAHLRISGDPFGAFWGHAPTVPAAVAC